MNVIPFVHEGLGNSSYMVQIGEGEAALIDPDRSTARYLDIARAQGWRIKSVFETHLHADFVSGARELGVAVGAQVYLPHDAEAGFPHTPVAPGRTLRLGRVGVDTIASPGHTPEHLSYVFRAEGEPPVLFSGGSLIVGGAARTDLLSPDLTEPLTRAQYRTLAHAFSSLEDRTALYPTHGSGSFCSSGGDGRRVSTLGQERATNPVLAVNDEETFAGWFPTTFPAAPDYFFRMRAINQRGPRLRREVPPPPPLSPRRFDGERAGAWVVDVRPPRDYAHGHIPSSLSMAFRSAYATWLGWLVPADAPLLFVTGGTPVEDVVDQSLLVGYERFAGWLDGGIEAWEAAGLPLRRGELIDGRRAQEWVQEGAAPVDVRQPDEFAGGHIPGAVNLPLGRLAADLLQLPRGRTILAYCGVGERAATGVSILERAGFDRLLNLDGGMGAWRRAGYPVETGAGRPGP